MTLALRLALVALVLASGLRALPHDPLPTTGTARPAQALPRAEIASRLAAWRAAHGPSWQADVDPETGWVDFLWGGHRPLATGSLASPSGGRCDDEQLAELARLAVSVSASLHGVDPETLVLERVLPLPLSRIGSSDKTAARFRQRLAGVPVDGATVNVLLDDRGALLAVQSTSLPGVRSIDVDPKIGLQSAMQLATELFRAETGRTPDSSRACELVVRQVLCCGRRVPALAWRTERLSVGEGHDPVGLRLWIDALDGRLLASESVVHGFDVTGTVKSWATPGVEPDSNLNPPALFPVPHVEVRAKNAQQQPVSAVTDANGDFVFPGVNSVTDVEVGYTGPFCEVTTGASYFPFLLNTPVLNGLGNQLVMNTKNGGQPDPSDPNTAEANAFLTINAMRDLIRFVNPQDPTADFPVAVTVNVLSNSCNGGKYTVNGPKLIMYRPVSFQNCRDGSYSTMIAHELGHWLSSLYGSGGGSGMREGTADVFALYLFDTPFFAIDIFGLGSGPGRTGENLRPFCGYDQQTNLLKIACYNDIYKDGEPWMGAAWKVRRNLHLTYADPPNGYGMGDLVADSLFFGWLNAFDQNIISPKIRKQWLVLDDDDGNLCTSTPNFQDIEDAFVEQGFPPIFLSGLCTLVNVPPNGQPPDTPFELGPYTVTAQIQPPPGQPVFNPLLRYRVNGGTFVDVPLVPTAIPSMYVADIPGQSSPARVQYMVQTSDPTGAPIPFPDAAPAELLSFLVGERIAVFEDDFDVDRGWTVVSTSLAAGEWERVDPVGTPFQPEDDHTPGAGLRCWVTGQATLGGDPELTEVKGGPTRLISPLLDFHGFAPVVSFAWWLSNPLGDDSLVLDVSLDGGAQWNEIWRRTGGDVGDWLEERLVLDVAGAPTDRVRLRFSAADQPDDSVLEAALDDFLAEALIPTGFCAPPTVYCSAKPSSCGTLPSIGAAGLPSASATSGFTVRATGTKALKTGILLYTDSGPASLRFQGGTLCLNTQPLRRSVAVTDTLGTAGSCNGELAVDMNAFAAGTIGGNPLASLSIPGTRVHCQFWARDAPGVSLLSDALGYTVCP